MRLALTASLCALAATALAPADARACSFIGNSPYELDAAEQAVDTTPPPAIVEADATVSRRGTGPSCEGLGSTSSSSCDDIGMFSVRLTPGVDDRTADGDLGYRVVLVSGSLPKGMTLPAHTVKPPFGHELLLFWDDGATDDQEAFSATLGVIPVDRAGNEGPMFEVRVSDGGSGCAAGGRVPEQAAWVVLALLLMIANRERARRCAG